MDAALLDEDTLPLARKSVLPRGGFFMPDDVRTAEREAEAEAQVSGVETAVIADPDPDGLGCVALIEAVHGTVGLVPAGPHYLTDALERVNAYGDSLSSVFICDLAPDDFDSVAEPLAALLDRNISVTWYDHHQWEPDVEDTVAALGIDLIIGDSDAECTADVAVRSLPDSLPSHLVELALVTRDHDLWIKEDPRSDDLADFAYWSDPAEYVATVREHGPALPPPVRSMLAERREQKHALIDLAVDRARLQEIGPWTVGLTYGRCSQNEVAERLREAGADAAVIVKPTGSASIRGSPTFERCHEVARQVNGGGHPRAAGCKPAIYEDMLDYAHHWVTEGAVTTRVIREAFEDIVPEEAST